MKFHFVQLYKCVQGGETMAKDLVCGMMVDEETPVATTVYQEKTYYFCSEHCKQQFVKEPQKYIRDNPETPHH